MNSIWFGLICMIVSFFIGIIGLAAHAQALDLHSCQVLYDMYKTAEGMLSQNMFKYYNDLCGTILPLTPPQTQQPQYQQPLQQPYPYQPQPPQAQFNQPQQQGMGQLMNESAVIGCLNHVLNNALVKANVSKFVSQANLTNSMNELDACILPRR